MLNLSSKLPVPRQEEGYLWSMMTQKLTDHPFAYSLIGLLLIIKGRFTHRKFCALTNDDGLATTTLNIGSLR
jgi:hypothetical protein